MKDTRSVGRGISRQPAGAVGFGDPSLIATVVPSGNRVPVLRLSPVTTSLPRYARDLDTFQACSAHDATPSRPPTESHGSPPDDTFAGPRFMRFPRRDALFAASRSDRSSCSLASRSSRTLRSCAAADARSSSRLRCTLAAASASRSFRVHPIADLLLGWIPVDIQLQRTQTPP